MRLILLCFILLMLPIAEAARADSVSSEDQAQVKKVSAYLNSIKSIQSEFLQISSTGETSKGKFLLSRPRHLRIDYDPPNPVFIVANNGVLSFADSDLKQVTHLPIALTPAGILLQDSFDFSGKDLAVQRVERGANVTRITIVRSDDPLAGQLTLVVSESPMVLRKWTVIDAQGIITDVTLINPRFDYPIAGNKFDADFSEFNQVESRD